MKKIQLVVLTIAIYTFCNGQSLSPDKIIMQVARDYFRSNPFNKEFSSFLNQLMNDPTLINKTIHKNTDTNYFYLRGIYTTHNPFFFKANETQVVLAESSANPKDTTGVSGIMMTYQLVGYTAGGEEGESDVKKEFEKFDRKYIKKIFTNNYSELKNGNEITGAIRNYLIIPGDIAPLSAAWQKIGKGNGNVFVITIRFRIDGNQAMLPVSPDSF